MKLAPLAQLAQLVQLAQLARPLVFLLRSEQLTWSEEEEEENEEDERRWRERGATDGRPL